MNGTVGRGAMFDLQILYLLGGAADVNARVLIIEDDKDIADLISLYLGRDGIETIHREDGESGLSSVTDDKPDLVVLDINLPGMDGYEVLQTIRRDRDIPVILVTARQEDEDAILGFGMGADDYVSKPFSPKVLAARVRSHLSKARKNTGGGDSRSEKESFRFGPYILDSRTFSLLKNEEKLTMSPREIDLLVYLARSAGEPRGQEQIYKEVWGKEFGDISTVAVHIQRIRRKIEEDSAHPRWIKTAHGRGYFLDFEGKG